MYREQYREYAYWCQGVNWGLTRSFASVWASSACRGLLTHLKGYNSNLKHYDNHGHLIKNCLIIKKHFEMGQWLGLFSLKFRSLFTLSISVGNYFDTTNLRVECVIIYSTFLLLTLLFCFSPELCASVDTICAVHFWGSRLERVLLVHCSRTGSILFFFPWYFDFVSNP